MVLYSVQVRRFGLWWYIQRDLYVNEKQVEELAKLHTDRVNNRKQKRRKYVRKIKRLFCSRKTY